jgi:hypothetical protein
METMEASKIELILGDAVRLLVESGASASVVGPFALKFGAKVAQRLAVPDQAPSKPKPDQELQVVIQAAVDSAVTRTLALQAMGTKKSVRLKVGPKDAQTTVTFPEVLMTRAIDHWGDKRSANAQIRAIFDRAPIDAKVKSRWLAEELKKELSINDR